DRVSSRATELVSMEDRRPLLPLVTFVAVVGCMNVVSCGSPHAPSRHELIDSRDEYDPRSLDPALSVDVPTGRAVGYLFDGLTRFSPDAKVEPGLAERWEVSPDGRVYTFHLHTGVKFQDGRPCTARNVLHSWMRALDPATKSGASQFLFPIAGAKEFNAGTAKTISGVVIRDDTTLVVTLTQPLAIFPKMLAMPVASVVPDSTPANFGEHPIGTGPWRLVEWKHDDYLLFARNPTYFGGAPKVDSLRARIIAEPSTAVAEYESGNVDILEIPASEAEEWVNDESRKPQLMSTLACGRQSTTRSTSARSSSGSSAGAAPAPPASCRPLSRDTTVRGSRIHTIPPRRARSSPQPAIRTGSTSSSGPRPPRSTCALPRRCRPISTRSASGPRSYSAKRRPRAPRRARDRRISYSRIGMRTIQTPKTFSIRCCTATIA